MTASTKLKIIRTAAREFADNGYRKTTIRAICQKAGVNVAAVNYHFSGKAELYCKTFNWLLEAVCAESKIMSSNNHSPVENIRLWVGDCIREHAAGKSWQKDLILRIVHHEMQRPSENYDYIYQSGMASELEILSDCIKRGMNNDISETEIKLRVCSLLGQTFFYVFHQNLIKKYAGTDFLFNQQSKIIDTIVANVTRDFVSE